MKDSEVNVFISKRFDTLWVDTPIEYQNQRISTDGLPEWIRLTVHSAAAKQISYKGGAHRIGSIDVQVFTKVNVGSGRATELAEKIGQLFDGLQYKTLVFKPYMIYVVGESIAQGLNTVKSGWYQVNCSIDFSFID